MILRFLVLLFDIRCFQSHAIISENILCFKCVCMPTGRREVLQPGVTVLTTLKTYRMAERVGFEPTVPGLAEHTISSRAPSANSGISPHSEHIAFSHQLSAFGLGLILEAIKLTKFYLCTSSGYLLGISPSFSLGFARMTVAARWYGQGNGRNHRVQGKYF